MSLEGQGYEVTENVFEQDNESAIKLEQTAAHLRDRNLVTLTFVFLIKDRIRTEKIEIRHCPTPQMLADFFTKPLQGSFL